MKMFKTFFGLVFWLLVYAGSGYAIYTFWYVPKYNAPVATTSAPPPRVPAVRVVQAEPEQITVTREVQGRVVARKQGALNFRTSGCVLEVYGDPQPGDLLAQGSMLGRLNDAQAKLEVLEGTAKVTQFDARIEEAKIALGIKTGVSDRADKALAEERVRYERQKDLFGRALSTKQSLETAERALQSAEELRNVSAEDRVLSEAQLGRLTTELRVIEAQLERARIHLSDLVLRVPRPVRVLKNNLRIGDCVTSTTPVFDIYEPDSLEINVEVPSLLIRSVAKNMTLLDMPVAFAPPFADCKTTITGIEPKTQTPNTQVLRLPLPRDCHAELSFQQNLTMALPTQTLGEVIKLPKSAERDRDAVFVVVDGKLSRREVKITARDETWAYVANGLTAGDQVLVSGAELAVEGLVVKVISP